MCRLNRFKLTVSLTVVLLTPTLFSETTSSYSLTDIFNLAVSYNETIALQNEALLAARSEYEQTRRSVLPYIGLLGSEVFQDTTGVTQGSGASSTFTASRKQEYKLTAKQSLYSGNRDKDALNALSAKIRQETIGFKQVKLKLYQSVTDAFFTILYLQKDLDSIQESSDIVSARIKELTYRVKIGKSRQSEVLSAEAQLARLNSQKDITEGQLQRAKISLANLIGIPLENGLFKEPSDSTLNLLEPLPNTYSTHSTIQQLEEEKRYYDYMSLSERHASRPKVSAGANYYLDRTSYLSSINWDVNLSLEIPLYQGGAPKAAAETYTAYSRSVDLSLKQARRAISSALLADKAERDALFKEKTSLELAYKKAKDSYAVYVDEYRLGLVNNLDVLQAATLQLDIKQQLDHTSLNIKRNAIQFAIDNEELP